MRELGRDLLASTLQAILDQSWQAECSGQPGLWQFVNAFFQHDIIDARLLGQAVSVFQRLEGTALAQRLKSQYCAYLELQPELCNVSGHGETSGLLDCLSLSEDP